MPLKYTPQPDGSVIIEKETGEMLDADGKKTGVATSSRWTIPANQIAQHSRMFNEQSAETPLSKGDADEMRDRANEFKKQARS